MKTVPNKKSGCFSGVRRTPGRPWIVDEPPIAGEAVVEVVIDATNIEAFDGWLKADPGTSSSVLASGNARTLP